ncbi:MAG: hypothetical protein FWG44_06945 [Oscillospiraceae bacterium]|nr:hypothetical protein [Oscillospiraceae bacterium]
MAVIVSLREDLSKNIELHGEHPADYCFNSEHFSIWSYKNGDINRNGACTQNMQFNKEMAKILRDALNVFLQDI